jgi:hypothetical protein
VPGDAEAFIGVDEVIVIVVAEVDVDPHSVDESGAAPGWVQLRFEQLERRAARDRRPPDRAGRFGQSGRVHPGEG